MPFHYRAIPARPPSPRRGIAKRFLKRSPRKRNSIDKTAVAARRRFSPNDFSPRNKMHRGNKKWSPLPAFFPIPPSSSSCWLTVVPFSRFDRENREVVILFPRLDVLFSHLFLPWPYYPYFALLFPSCDYAFLFFPTPVRSNNSSNSASYYIESIPIQLLDNSRSPVSRFSFLFISFVCLVLSRTITVQTGSFDYYHTRLEFGNRARAWFIGPEMEFTGLRGCPTDTIINNRFRRRKIWARKTISGHIYRRDPVAAF